MKTPTHTTFAEGTGQTLGHAYTAYKRHERRVAQWMVERGLAAGTSNIVMWGVKLLALGVLLYVAFWLTLVALFVLAAAWLARTEDDTADDTPQWRNGLSGYGLYRGDVRIDPGTTDDE
jgi:hypothetical protein